MSENTQPVLTLAEQIEALKAQVAEAEGQANTQLVESGSDFFDALFGGNVVKKAAKEGSTWHGFTQTLTLTRDGKPFQVTVTVKDVEASKAAADKARADAAIEKEHGGLLARLAELEAQAGTQDDAQVA